MYSTPVPPGQITLSDWNILIVDIDGESFEKLIGYDTARKTFRISSRILTLYLEEGTANTESGSSYTLVGSPGRLHPQARIVYQELKHRYPQSLRLKYAGNDV